MEKLRYIFDVKSEKAIFYQSGGFLFPIGGNKAAYWIDGDYVFPVGATQISFWVLGNEFFGHLGNGELTREPVYYIGD